MDRFDAWNVILNEMWWTLVLKNEIFTNRQQRVVLRNPGRVRYQSWARARTPCATWKLKKIKIFVKIASKSFVLSKILLFFTNSFHNGIATNSIKPTWDFASLKEVYCFREKRKNMPILARFDQKIRFGSSNLSKKYTLSQSGEMGTPNERSSSPWLWNSVNTLRDLVLAKFCSNLVKIDWILMKFCF